MPAEGRPDPARAVGEAIQNLMAARLARAFVPLGVAFALGLGRAVAGGHGALLVAGAAIGALLATLAYGLRVVQRALGRRTRAWMTAAALGSVVPPAHALHLLGWEGLRPLGPGLGPGGIFLAILHVLLGVWLLRTWMKVVEIEQLARIMLLNPHQDGSSS